jgi:predicted nucleic acid-binding protein
VRAFFDTNVIVYAHDRRDARKHRRALDLVETHMRAGTLVVSTQVLSESYSALQRAALLDKAAALAVVDALADETVVPATAACVLRGLRLSQRYGLSHWDGLIVQAAIDAGCTTLFTEELQAGQRFDDLEVVDPFADAAHEPRAKIAAKRARKPAARRTR